MKLVKYMLLLALAGVLAGCDHGFEGEYQTKAGSSNEMMNQLISEFSGLAGTQRIVIGSDYIEQEGQRTEFDDIFVRESGESRYLVFKDKGSEEAWKIVDDNTLVRGNGIMNMVLERVE
ncbi:hypothetical protein [Zobellella aerophila]|uniref:Lipoprotein n=1 Tax=Zobellella aerophila TaxID=870480 RepID=A0ABP6VC06_9GAMM